jgi:branched-chain amino acid transport system permease protein
MSALNTLSTAAPTRARLRLTNTLGARIGIAIFIVAIFAIPFNTSSGYWLQIGAAAGTAAIAATGLNLLTGYSGLISLGNAFFVAVGAFACQYFGGVLGLPFVIWLPIAAIIAALCGAIVAPFALRLRGPYLAIVSLGLVFIGIWIARNVPSITGGLNGTAVTAPVAIGPLDFAHLQLGPLLFSRDQGIFLLIWLVVGLSLLFTANIVRTRAGRAMQAVRDHDAAAEILGVRMLRTKSNAFVASAFFSGIAGGLLAVNLQFIRPENFDINLSVQYLAVIVIGGMASIWGPVVGALFVSVVPELATLLAEKVPFLDGSNGGLSSTDLSLIVYGALIVGFLLWEPKGLIALLGRATRRLRRRPASAPTSAAEPEQPPTV